MGAQRNSAMRSLHMVAFNKLFEDLSLGVGLACAADIVMASPSATFELSEAIFGLVPANVIAALIGNRLSPHQCRYLSISTDRLCAADAQRIGLVDLVVDEEKLETSLKALIRRLLRTSPDAIAEVKNLIDEIGGTSTIMEKRFALAKAALLRMAGNNDTQNALKSFADGEVPAWFGKIRSPIPLVLEDDAHDQP